LDPSHRPDPPLLPRHPALQVRANLDGVRERLNSRTLELLTQMLDLPPPPLAPGAEGAAAESQLHPR
jgi:hypothetical protein